jgi:hypothetical protein
MEDDREGAAEAIAPLLALPPERRIDSLATTLGACRSLLGGRLAGEIEGFCATGLTQSAARALPDGGSL